MKNSIVVRGEYAVRSAGISGLLNMVFFLLFFLMLTGCNSENKNRNKPHTVESDKISLHVLKSTIVGVRNNDQNTALLWVENLKDSKNIPEDFRNTWVSFSENAKAGGSGLKGSKKYLEDYGKGTKEIELLVKKYKLPDAAISFNPSYFFISDMIKGKNAEEVNIILDELLKKINDGSFDVNELYKYGMNGKVDEKK